jgi:hypothetical protein
MSSLDFNAGTHNPLARNMIQSLTRLSGIIYKDTEDTAVSHEESGCRLRRRVVYSGQRFMPITPTTGSLGNETW